MVGYVSDDLVHQSLLKGDSRLLPPEDASIRGLFSVLDDSPEHHQVLLNQGVLPWWTDEHFALKFWRPLTEVSLCLDNFLFPQNSAFAHFHSVLWYLLAGLAVYFVYKKTNPIGFVPLLGVALFLLDSTHAPTITWIANRSVLIASFFAFFSLLAHSYSATHSRHSIYFSVLSYVCLIFALATAEYSVAIGGYFFAYAFFKDPRGSIQGFVRLIPHLLIVVIWAFLYLYYGFGSGDSFNSQYIDPFKYPIEFVSNWFWRMPSLLFSQLGFIPAETFNVADLLSFKTGFAYWFVALSFVVWVTIIIGRSLQWTNNVKFWLTAMVLSTVPVSSTVPMDRLLLLTGAAASGLLAEYLNYVLNELRSKGEKGLGNRKLVKFLVVVHLLLSPILLPIIVTSIKFQAAPGIAAAKNIDIRSSQEDVVIVWGSIPISNFIIANRHVDGLLLPATVGVLTSNIQSIKVSVIDDFSLRIQPKYGFIYKWENIFRDTKDNAFFPMQVITLQSMTITIDEVTEDFRPRVVTFKFNKSLTDPDLILLHQKGMKLIPFELPEVGEQVTLSTRFDV
jgi:hypothetical protein